MCGRSHFSTLYYVSHLVISKSYFTNKPFRNFIHYFTNCTHTAIFSFQKDEYTVFMICFLYDFVFSFSLISIDNFFSFHIQKSAKGIFFSSSSSSFSSYTQVKAGFS